MNEEEVKKNLLIKYPFFGSIIARTPLIPTTEVKTASTNGKIIRYNPEYVKTITEDQQLFLIAHEVCHIAFNHILRSKGKDKETYNIAADAVINAFLLEEGLEAVDNIVNIPDAIKYNVDELYDILIKEKEEKEKDNKSESQDKGKSLSGQSSEENNQKDDSTSSNNSKENNSKLNSKGDSKSSNKSEDGSNKDDNKSEDNSKAKKEDNVGHDSHEMWDEAIKEKENAEEENDDKLDDLIKKIGEIGEKKIFEQNKIERSNQIEELKKALAKQSYQAGSTTNSVRREVNDIGYAKPLIDWRLVLRETINFDVDFSYRHAVIEDGILKSTLEEIPQPETEIVLDTSGSVNTVLLRNFLRECKNILLTSKVKVGCFDTKFYGFHEIKDFDDIDNFEFIGGGGTSFNAAIKAFTNRGENKIIFTDGEAAMPNVQIDAIWVVFGNGKIKPVGGKVIYIDDEQLDKLLNLNYGKSKY